MPKRKQLRLNGYDYSREGMYFVTVCVKDMRCVFGEVMDGEVRLNEVGRMVEKVWRGLSQYCVDLEIDEFIFMPNHMHGIIKIVGAGLRARPQEIIGPAQRPARTDSLLDIMHRFKSFTSAAYRRDFLNSEKLWHRSFHDRIIRNEQELRHIRQYIINNPKQWELDQGETTVRLYTA